MSRRSLIIVDDFFNDPDAIRTEALAATYHEISWFPYPGRVSVATGMGTEKAQQDIEALVGTRLQWSSGAIHARYRIALGSDAPKGPYGGVHSDPFSFNAIVCLTRDEHCRGGTSFFRHLPTQLVSIEEEPEARLKRIRHETGMTQDELVTFIARDSRNPEAWDELMRVDFRYNRLILFMPHYFHAATEYFGTSLADGRLTQNFSAYLPDETRFTTFY